MNQITKIFIGVVFFIALYLIGTTTSENVACARSWDTCPGAGNVPVSEIYPGQNYVDSVGLNFKITGKNIPPNQVFRIDVGAAACTSEVKCLKRSDSTTTSPFNGTASYGNIQTIGCSSGGCDDNLQVNAYFSGGSFNGTCKVYAGDGTPDVLLPDATQSENIKSRNGTEMSFFFYFDCDAPLEPTPTITPTPGVTVTPKITITPTVGVTQPPGNTPPPTNTPGTPTPTLACPIPATPVKVTVTCIGCDGGSNPIPTLTPTPITSEPTPTGGGESVTPTGNQPTTTPRVPTPTIDNSNPKGKPGEACNLPTDCISGICKQISLPGLPIIQKVCQ